MAPPGLATHDDLVDFSERPPMSPLRARRLTAADGGALRALWESSPQWLPQHPGFGEALAGDDAARLVRVGVFDADRLRGVVSFWATRQRGATRWLGLPFTSFGGALVAREDADLTGRAAERFWRDFLAAFGAGVGGGAARCELTLAPDCPDGRGLAWTSAWALRPHYNYVTRWQADGAAWADVESSVRRQARKAQAAGLAVHEDAPGAAAQLGALWLANAQRQAIDAGLREPLQRLAEWLTAGGHGFVVTTIDAAGVAHCGALVGHDARRCYYLAGASDPALRGSGAPSLQQQSIFAAIERRGLPRCYDWVGANTPAIAAFKAKFNPGLEVLIGAWRETPTLALMRAGSALLGSLGKKGNAATAPEGDE